MRSLLLCLVVLTVADLARATTTAPPSRPVVLVLDDGEAPTIVREVFSALRERDVAGARAALGRWRPPDDATSRLIAAWLEAEVRHNEGDPLARVHALYAAAKRAREASRPRLADAFLQGTASHLADESICGAVGALYPEDHDQFRPRVGEPTRMTLDMIGPGACPVDAMDAAFPRGLPDDLVMPFLEEASSSGVGFLDLAQRVAQQPALDRCRALHLQLLALHSERLFVESYPKALDFVRHCRADGAAFWRTHWTIASSGLVGDAWAHLGSYREVPASLRAVAAMLVDVRGADGLSESDEPLLAALDVIAGRAPRELAAGHAGAFYALLVRAAHAARPAASDDARRDALARLSAFGDVEESWQPTVVRLRAALEIGLKEGDAALHATRERLRDKKLSLGAKRQDIELLLLAEGRTRGDTTLGVGDLDRRRLFERYGLPRPPALPRHPVSGVPQLWRDLPRIGLEIRGDVDKWRERRTGELGWYDRPRPLLDAWLDDGETLAACLEGTKREARAALHIAWRKPVEVTGLHARGNECVAKWLTNHQTIPKDQDWGYSMFFLDVTGR
jgi:hypothetical protein